MKKFSISSLLSQLLLLFFVIIWIIPTFGLFISSLRDKDLLAISGWWTSLTTTEVNEIYRMSGMESQIEEDGYFKIKGKLFEDNSGKKIESFGITSKKINEFNIGDVAIFKDGIIRHTSVIPFGGNIITDDIKEGCSIIEKQAELLKIKFGSAWPGENKDNEIVSIPGLRGREPKEITLKNLSKIIHARAVEIIEHVYLEIKNYGHEEQKKKLIAGIVLTGGGSQLKHLKQLVEYITGMDTRLGSPNEHLAGNNLIEISNPTYATAVGLVMNARDNYVNNDEKLETTEVENETEKIEGTSKASKQKSIFEKFTEKLKKFLENAE